MRSTLAWMCLMGLAACASSTGGGAGSAPASAQPSAPLAGTRWVGVVDKSVDANAAPRLEFVGEKVSGYTGCNMLGGTWRMEGGDVRFGPIATTKRMCLGPGGEIEKRLLAALGSQARGRREGGRLVLEGPNGARFEFVEAKT